MACRYTDRLLAAERCQQALTCTIAQGSKAGPWCNCQAEQHRLHDVLGTGMGSPCCGKGHQSSVSVIRSQAFPSPCFSFSVPSKVKLSPWGAHTRASYTHESCARLSRARLRAPWKSPVLKHLLTLLSSSGRLSVSAMAPIEA